MYDPPDMLTPKTGNHLLRNATPLLNYSLVYIMALLLAIPAVGQQTLVLDSSQPHQRKVVAGPEYKASAWKRFWWGTNYRPEWTTPITVSVINFDSAFGGLRPIALGGGRQTKSLHMMDARRRRYVLRTVNKTYSGVLPLLARGTFVEAVANDQTATIHPYAALTVPTMAVAAGVYHTRPTLWFVPNSKRLGRFNQIFANTVCLLEERPDGTHAGEDNFGEADDIDGSEGMIENITEDNDSRMDQHFYVKTRLFDMLIGDWGRHLDNWRWAQFDSGRKDIYQPVPKDRDQLYARFEGVMLKVIKTALGLKQLQSFGPIINDITWYNYPAMDIDRRFTNNVSRQTWIDSAKALQSYLTNDVIEKGVRQLPPEIFAISGQQLITALKQRRDDVVSYATTYYEFLAQYVDIPGSEKNEWFEIKRLNDNETSITVYKINNESRVKGEPLFSRVFLTNETKEIRLYGISGNDIYTVEGKVKKGIALRLIGGTGIDSISDISSVNGRTHKTKIYDEKNTRINASGETKIRLSDSTYVYPFEEDYHYNYSSYQIAPGLNPFYRLYLGVGYKYRIYGWREKPYKSDFRAGINFSLFEKSFHPYVSYTRPQLFGGWNMHLAAGYDGARRLNYFGLGNNTVILSNYQRFHWLRTENLYTQASLNTPLNQYSRIYLTLFYDGVKVLPQEGRYISNRNSQIDPSTYQWKHFAGTRVEYQYEKLNDPLVPTKGAGFLTSLSHTKNIQQSNRSYTTASALIDFYQPVSRSFSLYIRSGGATLWGTPEFYQNNTIGSGITVRGYVRNRFFGRSVYYQQNELRFIRNVKSRLFNGKAGLIALYDFGKVWQPGERSDKWHYGMGGGFMLAPFGKFSASVYYAISPEDRVINLRIGRFF